MVTTEIRTHIHLGVSSSTAAKSHYNLLMRLGAQLMLIFSTYNIIFQTRGKRWKNKTKATSLKQYSLITVQANKHEQQSNSYEMADMQQV